MLFDFKILPLEGSFVQTHYKFFHLTLNVTLRDFKIATVSLLPNSLASLHMRLQHSSCQIGYVVASQTRSET